MTCMADRRTGVPARVHVEITSITVNPAPRQIYMAFALSVSRLFEASLTNGSLVASRAAIATCRAVLYDERGF